MRRTVPPGSLRLGVLVVAFLLGGGGVAFASSGGSKGPELFGIPIEFFLFGGTLVSVALFHKISLYSAVGGMLTILVYKLATGFHILRHLQHEWCILVNLLCLLLGFAILAKHFEESKIPQKLPAILPNDWKGGLVLLILVFFLSSFLDNIAAAMIGGVVARTVFKGKVHIGYIAGIVAASNAGGAGSVVGDTTTTMMWIGGVGPLDVLHGGLGAIVALLVFGAIAARQQHAYQPITKKGAAGARIDWARVGIVGLVLVFAIGVNTTVNVRFNQYSDLFPFIGVGVWAALLLAAPVRKPDWKLLPGALKGSCFLLSLVLAASMMPVERLPAASWKTTFGLGFVSAVFDNIPLTKLALDQGGYDWGFLAYAVGFGGSMIWFGSSAGVAISIEFPEARSAGRWLRHGWHVAVAYVVGFFAILLILGWHPHESRKKKPAAPAAATVPADKR